MHPYYQRAFGYRPEDCPHAAARFEQLAAETSALNRKLNYTYGGKIC